MRDFGRKKRKSRVRHEVALYQPPFKEEIMSSFGQGAHKIHECLNSTSDSGSADAKS